MAGNTIRASDFEAAVGVGADLKDNAEPANTIVAEMAYLGLSNMRVDAPATNLSTYQALAAAGMKLDVITSSTDIPTQIGYFDSIASSIVSIEGPDEPNSYDFTYNGLSGPAAADAFQADLFNAIKADPALANVTVLPFSLSVGDDQTGYGNVSAYANAGNIHAYTGDGGGPNQSIVYEQNLVSTTPGEADYLTETGYYTLNDGSSGVTDYVQAIWLVDSLLDGAADGLTKTFLYELNDGDDPSQALSNYGLFTASGQAKPSADAISNLVRILADNGASASTFTPDAPDVTVSGLGPINGFDQVFAKSSGQTDIAVWAEPQFYDPATGVATAFSYPISLTFGGADYNVAIYDPLAGSTSIQNFTDVSSIQINLGNEPLIVELTPISLAIAPVAALVAATVTSPVTVTSPATAANPDTATSATPTTSIVPATATTTTTTTSPSSATLAGNAMRASDFEASVGVGVNLGDGAEPTNLIVDEMAYLRLSNTRVDAPTTDLSAYQALAAAGMTFDVVTSDTDIPTQIAQLDSIASSIASIEGPNDVNSYDFTYNGLSGPAAADAFQADLFNAIKADPALANVTVLPFSLSVGDNQTGYGNVSAYANAGNIHADTADGGGPNQSIAYEQNLVATTPGAADYLTETGYYTLNDGSSGVTDYVQAIWLVDSLLDGAADGLTKTFLYELNDGDNASDPGSNYGLFTASGQAKPSADAISNLMRILADNGASASTFTPGAPDVTVSGLGPINGFDQVFAKSSGQTDIAVWAEPQFYDPATGVATAFSSPISLTFGGGDYDVAIYDPLAGSTPIQNFTDVSSIQINLGNEPLIVQLTPIAASAATASAAAVDVPSTAAAITSTAVTSGAMSFIGGQTAVTATPDGPTGSSATAAAGLTVLNAAASGAVQQPAMAAQDLAGSATKPDVSDIGGSANQLIYAGSTHGAAGFANAPDRHQTFGQT